MCGNPEEEIVSPQKNQGCKLLPVGYAGDHELGASLRDLIENKVGQRYHVYVIRRNFGTKPSAMCNCFITN